MRNFKFEREGNRWFIVLPEWEGIKDDLEMVCGADTMLDIVAQGENTAFMTISETVIENPTFILRYKEDQLEGGLYSLTSELHEFDVWLCHVTKFVYGYLPETLYCK
jgi:hypothetical protein